MRYEEKRRSIIFLVVLLFHTVIWWSSYFFTTDNYCNENRLACIQQNSIIDTILMINYSETIHFQNSIIQQL